MQAVSEPEDAARAVQHSPAHRTLVRLGLVVYGLIHLLVACLAALFAVGAAASDDVSQSGLLEDVAHVPAGSLLLAAAAVGFAALTLWQLAYAVLVREPSTLQRWRHRLRAVGRAGLYAAFAAATATAALAPGQTVGSEDSEERTVWTVFQLPFGQVLVGLIGVAVVAFGLALAIRGLRGTFTEDIEGELHPPLLGVAMLGHVAKGVSVGLVGALFVWAAIRHNPEDAGGLGAALAELRGTPFGMAVLALLIVGLAAYGVYCFVWARRPRFQ